MAAAGIAALGLAVVAGFIRRKRLRQQRKGSPELEEPKRAVEQPADVQPVEEAQPAVVEEAVEEAVPVEDALPAVEATDSTAASVAPTRVAHDCAHCGLSGAKMRCGNCRKVYFCDRECQRGAWKVHRSECEPTEPRPAAPAAPAAAAPPPDTPASTSAASPVALEQQRQLAAHQAMEVPFRRGVVAYQAGQWRGAKELFEEARVAAQQIQNKPRLVEINRMLGHTLQQLGQEAGARECMEEALRAAEELGDDHLQVSSLIGLGRHLQAQGELQAAAQYSERATALAARLGDVAQEAAAAGNLGLLQMSRGDTAAAVQQLRRAVELRERQRGQAASSSPAAQHEALRALAASTTNLAGAVFASSAGDGGGTTAALPIYLRALELAQAARSLPNEAKLLMQLANVYEHDKEHRDRLRAARHRTELADLMTSNMGRSAPRTCSICLEPFTYIDPAGAGDPRDCDDLEQYPQITVLECYHVFHSKCWGSWLQHRPSCPECKRGVSMYGDGD